MNTSRLLTGLATALAATALALPSALAETPALYPVQGYLTDADGAPIDGELDIRFRLYDASENDVFTELATVNIDNGAFTHYVGSVESLDAELFAQFSELSLGVKVGTDSEMSPRMAVGSVPYAARANSAAVADVAAELAGFNLLDFVPRDEAASITAGMLAEGSVDVAAVDGAQPIYRVTNDFCDVRPGTLSFRSKCYANQKHVDSCNNTCNRQTRARMCNGHCGCVNHTIILTPCPIGQVCPPPPPNPWPSAPQCDNELVGHILPQ
ncbi:hypothetical protein EA187_07825 [Lujinxingia sediminis]|uniref:Uncharacterized protein n=1 Tax=Lujinxingia sediminis TaxID=2480984 RepID=A0ABY0CVG7_9DELT|nr:hypothetical protein [Lujinxingia sediminis]RVU47031.1 hypothetical protein EA187_07825 [Lujinxingia sediminis]